TASARGTPRTGRGSGRRGCRTRRARGDGRPSRPSTGRPWRRSGSRARRRRSRPGRRCRSPRRSRGTGRCPGRSPWRSSPSGRGRGTARGCAARRQAARRKERGCSPGRGYESPASRGWRSAGQARAARCASIASFASTRPAPVCSRYALIASMTLPSATRRRHSSEIGGSASSRTRRSSASSRPARSASSSTRPSRARFLASRAAMRSVRRFFPNMPMTLPGARRGAPRRRSRSMPAEVGTCNRPAPIRCGAIRAGARRSGLRGALGGDDLDDQVGEDVLVQTDGPLVLAERADRGRELDGATVDVLVEHRLHALGDLLGGDRSEQTAVLAGALGDDEGLGLERGLQGLGVLDAGDRALAAGRTDLVELTLTGLGPRGGETAGHEEVAGVAVLDLDDVAGGTEAGDLVGEDELGGHDVPFLAQRPEVEYGSRAISRAFFTAFAILRCSWTETPVTRRARILPRSEMNLRSSAASL